MIADRARSIGRAAARRFQWVCFFTFGWYATGIVESLRGGPSQGLGTIVRRCRTMGLFFRFRLTESSTLSEGFQALQLRGGAANGPVEPAHIADDRVGLAPAGNRRSP